MPTVLRNICPQSEALLRHSSAARLDSIDCNPQRAGVWQRVYFRETFLETIFDLLVKTLCSPMNIRFSTNAGLEQKCVTWGEGILIVHVSTLSFSVACFERL